MLIEKNEAFKALCILEGKTPEAMQFDILQTGIECMIIPEEPICFGMTIQQCLEQEEGGNPEKFFSITTKSKSIWYLVQCVIYK
jgi:hypothetical protein